MRRTNQVKTLIAHQNPAAILMQLVGVYFNGQENGRPFLFSYGLQQPTRWTISTQVAMTANWVKSSTVRIIFQMKDFKAQASGP